MTQVTVFRKNEAGKQTQYWVLVGGERLRYNVRTITQIDAIPWEPSKGAGIDYCNINCQLELCEENVEYEQVNDRNGKMLAPAYTLKKTYVNIFPEGNPTKG